MDNITYLPPRPDMSAYRMPEIQGIRTVAIGESEVRDITDSLSSWLGRQSKPLGISYEDVAEINAHDVRMLQGMVRDLKDALNAERAKLRRTQETAAKWALRIRELEAQETTVGRVLASLWGKLCR